LGCMVFAIGWSGQWKYKLRRMGDTALLKLGFADCDMYLDPGESIRSAGAIVCGGRTLTETRQKFRRIFREKLSPYAKRGAGFTLPISLQTFDRYFPTGQPWATPDPTWATEEGQLRCIECAKKCGLINNYWLDAAWFRDGFPHGVGNYTCEKTFPRGLAPLSKAAHSLGMTFMLWFEVERVNINSDTAKEHPEWLLWNGDPENPYRIFNIGNEEAYRRLRDTLVDMVQKSGIDIFRLDFNRGPLLYWRRHEEPGRKGYLENKHITNLYRLWDELLREFPGLLIDNCAGGGGRLDYELLSRSVPLWRSDSGCYPVSEEHPTDIWHQNQTIGLTRYLPYHSTCSWTTEAYTFRSSSTMGIALDLDVMNDAFDGESTKAPLSELHSLRHLWNGDFYPLTEATLRDDVWCAYQLDLEGNGFAAFFRRENAESSEMTFTLNNIDTDKDYEITLSDENYEKTVKVVKGKDLASFTAHIPEAKQSLLLTYKTV